MRTRSPAGSRKPASCGGTRSRPASVFACSRVNCPRWTVITIAGRLEEAGIVRWYKEPGSISEISEHGVRLYSQILLIDPGSLYHHTMPGSISRIWDYRVRLFVVRDRLAE